MNNLGGPSRVKDGGKLERAARWVLDSQHVVALVGAGLSVESGIPPFRGPGGLWTRYGQPSMLSYQEFARDPRLWWETRLRDEVKLGSPVYELTRAVNQATPNAGHYALVELERWGVLKCSITQNVDDLQRRAGGAALVEVHGNRTRLRCIRCGSRRPREGFPMVKLPPRCPECEGILKLDTVMFGEAIPAPVLQACREQVQRCDCMLLIGTSGSVNPAAQLPLLARQGGARLVEVNLHETALTLLCDLTLTGRSAEVLPALVDRVRSGRAARGL